MCTKIVEHDVWPVQNDQSSNHRKKWSEKDCTAAPNLVNSYNVILALINTEAIVTH